jgi:CRP-like cAMP-binding protein
LRRVEAKEFVFAEGILRTHLFRVETRAIALYKISADGRRQMVGFAYPGDLIGLGSHGEHVMNAHDQADASALHADQRAAPICREGSPHSGSNCMKPWLGSWQVPVISF